MAATRYQRLAYRFFGAFAEDRARSNERLRTVLLHSHIAQRPDAFLATVFFTAALAGAFTALILLFVGLGVAAGAIDAPARIFFFAAPLPLVVGAIIYIASLVLPELRAASRGGDIDAKLPYAINFIATMASAGAPPERIFSSLSRQPIYGEVAHEAAWIARDMNVLGLDVLTAIGDAVGRTPSAKFQDFLQGAITTLSTGGNLKDYFNNKAEQYMLDNRQVQQQFLESLGVLAESFVVVVVAAPLFLMVILSTMSSLGGDPKSMIQIGYVLVLAMLPLAQAGFAFTLKFSTPEA